MSYTGFLYGFRSSYLVYTSRMIQKYPETISSSDVF